MRIPLQLPLAVIAVSNGLEPKYPCEIEYGIREYLVVVEEANSRQGFRNHEVDDLEE